MAVDRDSDTPVQRLRRLMLGPPYPEYDNDYLTSTPQTPLGPYGQHADPVGALVNFQHDLRAVFEALELLSHGKAKNS